MLSFLAAKLSFENLFLFYSRFTSNICNKIAYYKKIISGKSDAKTSFCANLSKSRLFLLKRF